MFNKCEVFIWDDEKLFGIDSGDGYTTLQMHLMQLIYILTNG